MAVLIPHFDLPFRFGNTSIVTVEQDSPEDVANCVEAIARTIIGERDDSPDFGIDDLTFSNQPLDTELLTAQILQQEPRATIVIREEPDFITDVLVLTVGK